MDSAHHARRSDAKGRSNEFVQCPPAESQGHCRRNHSGAASQVSNIVFVVVAAVNCREMEQKLNIVRSA